MRRFYKIPNVIFNYHLSPSAFLVYIHLTNNFYFTAKVRVKLSTISHRLNISINTARKAVNELHNKNLLTIRRRFNCNGHRSTNEYVLNKMEGGFSCVDRRTFCDILSTLGCSALVIYCAVVRCANKDNRAFPSYKQLSYLTALSRRCCIDKVRLIGEHGYLARTHYVCRAGDYGNNNYISLTQEIRFFLFNLLARAFAHFEKATEKLYTALKSKQHGAAPLVGTAQGSANFDKHIKDPLKYVLKIEKTNNLFSPIQTICKKLYTGVKSAFKNAASFVKKTVSCLFDE